MGLIDWEKKLAPEIDNATAWAFVGKVAKKWLIANVRQDDMISTQWFVEQLYPKSIADVVPGGHEARLRIVDALTNKSAGKYELAGCFTMAPPETRRVWGVRKTIHRRLWHPPVSVEAL